MLADRQRLAGERGLIRTQVDRRQHASVGRHRLSKRQFDDVSRHQCARIDSPEPAIAQDRGVRRTELAERLHSPSCAQLDREAERGIVQDDGDDGAGVHPVAEERGHERRHDEQQHDDARELGYQQAQAGNGSGADT